MAVYKTEQFHFSSENGKVFIFEGMAEESKTIAVYNVKMGNETESMDQFQNMCAPYAEIGLDYADLVVAVRGSENGSYYCFDEEEQFLRILEERDADTGCVLVMLEGDVSLASVVPYQELFGDFEEVVLFQIIRNENLKNAIRYHVWLFV